VWFRHPYHKSGHEVANNGSDKLVATTKVRYPIVTILAENVEVFFSDHSGSHIIANFPRTIHTPRSELKAMLAETHVRSVDPAPKFPNHRKEKDPLKIAQIRHALEKLGHVIKLVTVEKIRLRLLGGRSIAEQRKKPDDNDPGWNVQLLWSQPERQQPSHIFCHYEQLKAFDHVPRGERIGLAIENCA
jgi:hypothetical protein